MAAHHRTLPGKLDSGLPVAPPQSGVEIPFDRDEFELSLAGGSERDVSRRKLVESRRAQRSVAVIRHVPRNQLLPFDTGISRVLEVRVVTASSLHRAGQLL